MQRQCCSSHAWDAKLKPANYIQMANSPNIILAKFSRYTVHTRNSLVSIAGTVIAKQQNMININTLKVLIVTKPTLTVLAQGRKWRKQNSPTCPLCSLVPSSGRTGDIPIPITYHSGTARRRRTRPHPLAPGSSSWWWWVERGAV